MLFFVINNNTLSFFRKDIFVEVNNIFAARYKQQIQKVWNEGIVVVS
jgi:hypothetical protein